MSGTLKTNELAFSAAGRPRLMRPAEVLMSDQSVASTDVIFNLDLDCPLYRIVMQNVIFSTNDVDFYAETSIDNAVTWDSTAGDYLTGARCHDVGASRPVAQYNDQMAIHGDAVGTFGIGNDGTYEGLYGELLILGAKEAGAHMSYFCEVSFEQTSADGDQFTWARSGGFRRTTSSITNIRLLPSAGVMTGDFKLYGWKEY